MTPQEVVMQTQLVQLLEIAQEGGRKRLDLVEGQVEDA
jgi:hypothetical protein